MLVMVVIIWNISIIYMLRPADMLTSSLYLPFRLFLSVL